MVIEMFFPQMLLQTAENNQPFDDPAYLCNMKLDGIRLLVSKMGGRVNLYTKNQQINSRFPELLNPPINDGTIIDAELVVCDPARGGMPDFEAVMARFQSKKSKHKVLVVAFDILFCKGVDVRSLPLESRLELLNSELNENEFFAKMPVIHGSPVQLYSLIHKAGGEGLVLKKKSSTYRTPHKNPSLPGSGIKGIRSKSWLKVICYSYLNLVITGYSKEDLGWLIGEMDANGHVIPAGVMRHGLTTAFRNTIWPRLMTSKVSENKNFVFVEPSIMVRAKHRGRYHSGLLRLPVMDEVVQM
jgi:DNA ligase-1